MNEKIKTLIYILLLVIIAYITKLLLPLIGAVLSYIFYILLPFLIAFVLAFILQPLVEWLTKRRVKRFLAVVVVVVGFLGLIFLILYRSIPYLISEISILIENLPKIMADLERIVNQFASNFSFLPTDYQPTFTNISTFLTEKLAHLASFPAALLKKLFSILTTIVLVPILTIYLLLDYEKLMCYIRNKLISKDKIRLKNYLGDLNKTMGSYFRGMFLVMLIFSITASTLFLFVGIDFAIFFGIIIGVTNIIPYLGPYLGASFPILYTLVESPQRALLVAVLCVIMQFLETNFLTPYVHKRNLQIHPLLTIFSLILFGKLFGIIGMLLAVPLMSIILITFKHYYPNQEEA